MKEKCKSVSKRLLALLLSVIMLVGIMPIGLISANAETGDYRRRVLNIDWSYIKQIGYQTKDKCPAYSLAYCRAILDKAYRDPNSYWGSRGAQWGNAAYYINWYSTAQQAYRSCYDSINEGRPCVLLKKGLPQHYVAIVGYTNVTDINNLNPSNFLIIDPNENRFNSSWYISLTNSVCGGDAIWGEYGYKVCRPRNGYAGFSEEERFYTPAPASPSVSSSRYGDVAIGDPVTVSWGAVTYADGYNVYKNGNLVQQSANCSYTFLAENGNNSISVVAYNAVGNSGNSNTINITGRAPLTVKFNKGIGNGTETQTVRYGGNAIAPEPPKRTGYTFTGWDKSTTNITENVTINAVFKINTYTITFVDKNDKVLSTQKVRYGEDAVEPDEKNIPEFEKFVGWDSEKYKDVEDNATIKGIYEWANKRLPVGIINVGTGTRAYRKDDGYYVNIDIKNSNQITHGRAIVTLKTAEGKPIETAESVAFSIPANGTKSQIEVFTDTTKIASIAEIILVDSYSSGVPISEAVELRIDDDSFWTDWTEELRNDEERQTKTEYKVRTKEYSTACTKTKSGWEYTGTYTASTGNWSNWTWDYVGTYEYEAGKREVETQTAAKNPIYQHYYLFYHYHTNGKNVVPYWNGDDRGHRLELTYDLAWKGTSSVNNDGGYKPAYYGYYTCDRGGSNVWYKPDWEANEYDRIIGYDYATQYRYRDTAYFYRFWRWSDWSDWSTNPVSSNSENEVLTRTLYRYKNGEEDNTGNFITIASKVNPEFAGRKLTLFVYKFDGASDYTNEFAGQTTIAADGSYSFRFKLREEPTERTGDFTAAIGIEGTTNTIILNPEGTSWGEALKAPKKEYRVNFINQDGTLLSSQIVTEGNSAVVPTAPAIEGHTFAHWDVTTTSIDDYMVNDTNTDENGRGIINVNAIYTKNRFTVIFINWTMETVNVKEFEYGDPIIPPESNVTGQTFVEWEGLDEGMTVTQNMVFTAKYIKNKYTVRFCDFDGNVISEQKVEYGDSAALPTVPDKDDYVFLGWNTGKMLNVTEDMIVIPEYAFETTCETPVASVKSGTYTDTQTVALSCATDKAVIYYTLDGTDPESSETAKEYTEPLVISKSTKLTFIASCFAMNNSSTVSEVYAINTENNTSDWMLRSDLPDYVLGDLSHYKLKSATGYKYKDVIATSYENKAASLEADGWTYINSDYGEWSAWSDTEPVIAEQTIDVESRNKQPVDTVFYRYSHWKYFDSKKQKYVYTYEEIAGVNGEWEYLDVADMLDITSFIGDTEVYKYNGVDWFSVNETTVIKPVEQEGMEYRYRILIRNYYKWTSWDVTPPSANDTRERESAKVYSYVLPTQHVISVVPFGDSTPIYMLAFAGETISPYLTEIMSNEAYAIEGYEITGFCSDKNLTSAVDPDRVIDSDITVYVKSEEKTFNVTFRRDDGTVISQQTVPFGGAAVAPVVGTINGNAFIGWDSYDYENVTENITITAVMKPENEIAKVSLNRTRYALLTGTSFMLSATVTPGYVADKSLTWTSSDESIAYVMPNGMVTAVSDGTVVITATTVDNCSASCIFTVMVNPESGGFALTKDSSYKIDTENGYLLGIKNTANTVADVKAQFKNDTIRFTRNGVELKDTDLVGTGTKLELIMGNDVDAELIAVVVGDMNGDGYVNNRDVSMISRFLVDKEVADVSQLLAVDVNGDGKVNNRDAAMLARYLVGKETI